MNQKELNDLPEMEQSLALWQEEDQPTSVIDDYGQMWMIGWHDGVLYKRKSWVN